MSARTRAYLGDGVYATFDGQSIELTANGVDAGATDRIYLELGMPKALLDWLTAGAPDHSTGLTLRQTFEAGRR